MRRFSILTTSVLVIGTLASCGGDNSVRVRAIDTPPVPTAPVATVIAAAPAPAQLPSAAPIDPAATAAPVPAPVVAETVTASPPPPAPAPAPTVAPVTAAPVVVAAVPVVVEQAVPATNSSIGQNTNAAAPAAPAATTTAFTSPPTTVIVKHEMPNVVCMTLQDAQNLIQKAGVFYSKSFDATGKGRKQLWDRGWIVVSQNLAPGTAFGNGDAKLGAVKKDEPNDC